MSNKVDLFKGLMKPNKYGNKKSVLTQLYKIPKKDKGDFMPTMQETEPNYCHQADILFLPDDDGYKYALVVVDCATGKTDAEPLKEKSVGATLNAFKKIYKRGIIKMPRRLEVDPGAEFKGEVKKYFEDNNCYVRYGKVGRHRMQALAEARNKTIGTVVHKRQTGQELLTGEPSREWVDDLPDIIKAIDSDLPIPARKSRPEYLTGDRDLLSTGTKVRVILEEPRDVTSGKRLHGKFRSSDTRWDQKIRTIRDVTLAPGQPPLYLLDGSHGSEKVEDIGYTRNQLQVVGADEEPPEPAKFIRGNPKHYIIDKILDKKKTKGKNMYLVHWYGYTNENNTWEPEANLSLS